MNQLIPLTVAVRQLTAAVLLMFSWRNFTRVGVAFFDTRRGT